MSPSDAASFLEKLQASGLLTDTQFGRAEQLASGVSGGEPEIAGELVDKGLLSQYQAEQIVSGQTEGFVLGPYTVIERIGAGGMGQVYKAHHRQMDRVVALKVLHRTARDHAQAHARFLREIRASAKLNHPNIVAAYDVGEDGDLTYLVLEYVKGVSLYQLIKEEGPVDPVRAAQITYQAALALEHAHQQGIVHRDIKPSNILLSDEGVTKVLDMGLARITRSAEAEVETADIAAGVETSSTLTQTGVVMGTIDYLAPEQALDTHAADIRADIYSLGCTLYHMLSGQVPFPGGSATEKLLKHQIKDPTPLTRLSESVPAALVEIVNKMMTKQPEDRYQTPRELATALLPVIGASPSDASAGGSVVTPAPSTDDTPTSAGQDSVRARAGLEAAQTAMPTSTDAGASVASLVQAARKRRTVRTAAIAGLSLAVLAAVGVLTIWRPWKASDPSPADPGQGALASRTPTGEPASLAPTAAGGRTLELVVDPDAPAVQGAYPRLQDALAACRPQDTATIQIRTSGVLDVGDLTVDCGSVTLRAAPHAKPVLRASVDVLDMRADNELVLEGLHFVALGADITAPRVTIAECTFQQPRPIESAALVIHSSTRKLEVRDCFLTGFERALDLYMDSGSVRLANCVVHLRGTLVTLCASRGPEKKNTVAVDLRHNTVVGGRTPFRLARFSTDERVPASLTFDLRRNVLLPTDGAGFDSLLAVREPGGLTPEQTAAWRRALRWAGERNVIGRCQYGLVTEIVSRRGRPDTTRLPLDAFLTAWSVDLAAVDGAPAAASPPLSGPTCRMPDIAALHRSTEPFGAGANLSRVAAPASQPAAR